MSVKIATQLDVKGLACPMPVVKTALAMKELETGDVVEVLATDPGSVPDFSAWCKATRNALVEQSEEAGTFRFMIKKG